MSSTKEYLESADKAALDKAKTQVQFAVLSAEKAIAQNDVAKLSYSNLLLQLANKYSLTAKDAINEDGEIQRGAGVQPPPEPTA